MVRIDKSQLKCTNLIEDIESALNQLLFLYYVLDYHPTKDDLLKGCESAINNIFDCEDDGELEN